MSEDNYNKRELDGMFKRLDEKQDEQNSKLDKILEQTTKTNGRVNRLEMWQATLTGSGMVIKGMVSISGISLVGIVSLGVYTFIKIESIPTEDEWREYITSEVQAQLDGASFNIYDN